MSDGVCSSVAGTAEVLVTLEVLAGSTVRYDVCLSPNNHSS